MSYFNYDNFRNYFSYYTNSSQVAIYDPYSAYEIDIHNNSIENNNNRVLVLSIMFFLYIITSLIYINNIDSSCKRKITIYNEKLYKIQNEKTNMKKKYQNLIQSIKRIKEISLTDDRAAKKVCLISSELQSKFNRI